MKIAVHNSHGNLVTAMTGNIKQICHYAIQKGVKVAGIKEQKDGAHFITHGDLYFRYGVEQKVIISEGVVMEEELSDQFTGSLAGYSGQSGYQQEMARSGVTRPYHKKEEEEEELFSHYLGSQAGYSGQSRRQQGRGGRGTAFRK